MTIETDTALGDLVEKRRRIPRVVVHTHAFRAQRIDQDEKDVGVG